ncbi:FAD-dependent monooxygenase [Maritimibacter dapengensis]|uniref:FAD-dependent monooxygenase n=1 Tax=Maritimibacter dapengensis TaxID=2836868 RepID=A0ABS6T7W5_9RHOB|nr:FAD-dependent monooxygenase [Maritimibacter dapengensis]MBV7380621.1 FAD-dependent monooxygenase [Maritimibacter dapengensis]
MGGNLTNHVQNVLVVGGGVGGPAAAIRLAERGVKVDLIDIEENWGAAGTGVTLSSLTARALCDLGFAEDLINKGHLHDGLIMCDPMGNVVQEHQTPRLFSPDVPGEGGVMRPVLHDMMVQRMRDNGVSMNTGISVTELDQTEAGVHVTFTDGSTGTYDLVIGADGLFSKVRDLVMPDAPKPSYTGQVCWRAQMELPPHWTTAKMFLGPVKVGFTPYAKDRMYMFLLENAKDKPFYKNEELLPRLKALLAPFGGELAEIRDAMDEATPILARPLESVLIDGPWHVGRVLLIGDAAHATTPHLASGAGMAVEDAIVLVEELDRADNWDEAMSAFMARRLPRGKMVVGNSLELGRLEQEGAGMDKIGPLMGQSLGAIAQPY